MVASSTDPAQNSLQIRQDDKFYCRLLSKESSISNPSFRVYYGVAPGAVPFMWESQPGTPKHTISSTTLPPLTPPPSYQSSPKRSRDPKKSSSKSYLLNAILPSLPLRKSRMLPPSPPTSSPPSSVSSTSNYRRGSRFSSPRSSFSSTGDDDESDDGSPTSTLCFGVPHGGIRGSYKMVFVKNALLSMVGHGSSQGTA